MVYDLAYGQTSISLDLGKVKVNGVLRGNETPGVEDIRESLFFSLEHPVSSLPLREVVAACRKIVIVISDMTRFWMRQDLVVPHLVDYLNLECGVRLQDLLILVANGTHEGGSVEDLKKLVTPEVYSRVRVVNHDGAKDPVTYIGTTRRGTPVEINSLAVSADLVICLGAATHHVMAGFGGGRKSIVPGIASLKTVSVNHSLCVDPEVCRSNPEIGNGKLEGNPLNEDMCEAASFMKNLFMVNLVMNAGMKLCSITSGHYLDSWLEACRQVDRIYSISIPEKADVIIASCGGYPKDMSLYQGTKAVDNIESCLKVGGTLVLSIEARDGGGPQEYFGWISNLLDGTMEHRLRTAFTVAGYIFLLNTEQAGRYDIRMITSVPEKVLAPMGIKAYASAQEALEGIDFEGKVTYVIPNATTVIPRVGQD